MFCYGRATDYGAITAAMRGSYDAYRHPPWAIMATNSSDGIAVGWSQKVHDWVVSERERAREGARTWDNVLSTAVVFRCGFLK